MAAVATAVLPMFLDERPLGAIILDFEQPHHFTPDEVRFPRTLAAQGAIALKQARLSRDLDARVAARTADLEMERAALDAFIAYQEAVGSGSGVPTLARQAVQLVRANLEHVILAYYEREDERWRARVWSEDIPPEIVGQITAGVSVHAPNYAETDGVQGATSYGAAAFLPLVIHGETRGLFSVGTRQTWARTEREKALVRAVARGLALTLERTEYTRQLQTQNAELDAQTRALEAFADLSRQRWAADSGRAGAGALPAAPRLRPLLLEVRGPLAESGAGGRSGPARTPGHRGRGVPVGHTPPSICPTNRRGR